MSRNRFLALLPSPRRALLSSAMADEADIGDGGFNPPEMENNPTTLTDLAEPVAERPEESADAPDSTDVEEASAGSTTSGLGTAGDALGAPAADTGDCPVEVATGGGSDAVEESAGIGAAASPSATVDATARNAVIPRREREGGSASGGGGSGSGSGGAPSTGAAQRDAPGRLGFKFVPSVCTRATPNRCTDHV